MPEKQLTSSLPAATHWPWISRDSRDRWSSRLLAIVQPALRRAGLYYRLRASPLYDLYWSVVDRRFIDERAGQLRFYRQLLHGLGPSDLIFDIGANQGVKTDIFLRLGARVVAVDPDRTSTAILEEKFRRLRLRPNRVVVVPKAVADRETVTTMWVDSPGCTMNTLSAKWVDTLREDTARFGTRLQFGQTQAIETTTLDRLAEVHGAPFFIKIDVEGFEIAVLRGLTKAVPYLSFEVNLPEFRTEGLACVERLASIAREGQFNYAIDLRRGLELRRWLPPRAFSHVLEHCGHSSVEVFWRTGSCRE
ncbi:MAG: FkbM family methyltransferase [Vicinamibacterales bacterium]